MIEYYQWRKFNGITGRAKKVAPVEPMTDNEFDAQAGNAAAALRVAEAGITDEAIA